MICHRSPTRRRPGGPVPHRAGGAPSASGRPSRPALVRVLPDLGGRADDVRRGRDPPPASATVIAPPDLAGVTIVHQAGTGRAVTHGGSYPLGGLDLTHSPSGRGVLTLQAGAGALQLSGDKADEGVVRPTGGLQSNSGIRPRHGDCRRKKPRLISAPGGSGAHHPPSRIRAFPLV